MTIFEKENAMESTQVANYLIDRYDAKKYKLTNLKINKVIYFLHGYCLAKFDKPLVRNHFESWQHGPVVGTLYHALKKYGDAPVSRKISYLNYETGETEEVKYSEIFELFGDNLEGVAQALVAIDVWILVFQTHAEGGAWDQVRKAQLEPRRSRRIPDSLIAEHYRNLVGGKIVH